MAVAADSPIQRKAKRAEQPFKVAEGDAAATAGAQSSIQLVRLRHSRIFWTGSPATMSHCISVGRRARQNRRPFTLFPVMFFAAADRELNTLPPSLTIRPLRTSAE